MTTCPRLTPTIEESLAALSNYQVTIHDDPDMKGAFPAFDKALRNCISKGADYCLVLPDDMVIQRDWLELVQPFIERPQVGYLALYCPKGLGERYGFAKGINKVVGGWASSWGGCYLMPTGVAKKVVSHPFYQSHLNGTLSLKTTEKLFNYAKGKRIDHCIPEVIHRLKLKQLFYAPSLCRHIGKTSTLGHEHTEHEEPFLPS